MKTSLKDVPIVLPDGVPVKVGGKIYSVESRAIGSYRCKIKLWSGESRAQIKVSDIIHVNQDTNVRSFTVRSDRGCETTYTVKNNCLPQGTYGKLANAKRKAKAIDKDDIKKIQSKIDEQVEYHKEQMKKYKATIAALKEKK